MSRFVKISDFKVGPLKIASTTYTDPDFQVVIDTIEKSVLLDLLGKELHDLFVANWDAQPSPPTGMDARYLTIYNEIYDYEQCPPLKSKGIKDMLMNFIYFEFVRNQPFTNRVTGTKENAQENSASKSGNDFGLYNIYNSGVESYQSIQRYIVMNISTYPEYKGISKCHLSWL